MADETKKAVLTHFKAASGIVLGVATILGLLAFIYGEQWRATHAWLAVLNGSYIVVILYLFWIILARRVPQFIGAPKVVKVIDGQIVIVKDAPWLSLGVSVAIYIVDGEFERLVGDGEVINVQTNALAQIRLRNHVDLFRDISDLASRLDAADRTNILVRPGLYKGVIDES
ncbi:hypothetical protein [Aureimonas pseudogalii]|uniref:Uncharacterized protein n=1 Tax=Aureimonas pseudogalii TaxID=1744844 RepID=A0A7W6H4X1_9HYPH|nr:hypothetical protein [Aureimonas pseudogalii]MBB3998617.1 hypothetical protein [Aureimonas pseudogalii]